MMSDLDHAYDVLALSYEAYLFKFRVRITKHYFHIPEHNFFISLVDKFFFLMHVHSSK